MDGKGKNLASTPILDSVVASRLATKSPPSTMAASGAVRLPNTFRGESAFTTWLHRIAVNSALHGRRSRERRAGREEPMGDEVASVRPQGDNAVLRLRLEKAMERLPEGMRKVLVLHDVEGYTHEEIAEMLGVNPGTCKSQLFKARARMRALLSPAPSPAEGVEACST